ncbi:PAS domain S-box protein [Mastigocoleus testarum]|uniref:histidine kinase n=1 Tax=Mastigocoleus testarum BC008 TaxID=371196 RepID=A0A0V7ZMZ8_9CYAN|nr:PAS domain S-box protein [Mastigocoleus testarum]KST65939.1 hypothetical protein BC008_23515 [Mastigocoleus testarum BC008]
MTNLDYTAFNLVSHLICVVDVDGSIKHVNRCWLEITRLKYQEILGNKLFDLVSSEERENFSLIWQESVAKSQLFETKLHIHLLPNENPIWFLVSGQPHFNTQGEVFEWVVTYTNIQKYKQAEAKVTRLNTELEARVKQRTQELLEGEEKFRATFEQVAVGFAHVALDGRWLLVNQKLCEIVGYSYEEIINLTFQDITHPDDLETDLNYVRQLLVGKIEYYSMEKRYIRKDGSIVWVEITPSLIRNSSNNEPMYFIAVVEEIEDRKQRQLQLKQKIEELAQTNIILTKTTAELHKRNQELDQFAYFASHDLKAPLRAIANLSQWLEDDLSGNLPPENQRQLELLRGRVNRMENLINGLLEYSRVGRVEAGISTVNVDILLKEIVDSLAPPSEFTIEIESGMPIFRTKKVPLQQVFANLISNAIEHHPAKDGQVNISVDEIENFYKFTVCDDGTGIPPEFHQKIFTIFQTLEARDTKESTGVGLAIVRKIIDSVGGAIAVESQLKEGAKFIFTWPK